MTDRAVRLLSPDGTYRVTLDVDPQGQTVCTYTWDASGQDDTMAPSPRPLEDIVQWFRSSGWTDDPGGSNGAT